MENEIERNKMKDARRQFKTRKQNSVSMLDLVLEVDQTFLFERLIRVLEAFRER